MVAGHGQMARGPVAGRCPRMAGRRGVCAWVVTARLASALVAGCGGAGVIAADAGAAVGDLRQKPGLAACLSAIGPCSPAAVLEGAVSVTVSPDGRNAYVASFAGDALAVFDRAVDGTLTQKSGTAGCISRTGSGGACATGTAPRSRRFGHAQYGWQERLRRILRR